MKLFSAKRFNHKDKKEWDFLIKNGKNATFLFTREYVDYHSHRFTDHSVIVFNDKGNPVGCLPCNEHSASTVVSHAGLTYGGFVFKKDLKLIDSLLCIQSIIKYLQQAGFVSLIYKSIPSIYNLIPSDEVNQALFFLKAKLIRRESALVINRQKPLQVAGNIKREAKKAKESGFKISENPDLRFFWNELLVPNLNDKYKVKPTHNLNEVELLKSRFPENIKLFEAISSEGKIVAGTLLYLAFPVVHCQYIASNIVGKKSGALNYLFLELINRHFSEYPYFDFGIAQQDEGTKINFGLLGWKERFGGRSISHDFYEVKTSSYHLLEPIINPSQ